MRNNEWLAQALFAGLYLAAQLILFKNFIFFNTAFCMLYVGYILQMPVNIPRYAQMLIGFGVGLIMDISSDTLGIHIFSCVMIAYLRPVLLRLLVPASDFDDNLRITIAYMGARWFLVYGAILLFIFNTCFFLLESSGFELFWWTLLKILASTVFSLGMTMVFQYLFHTPNLGSE